MRSSWRQLPLLFPVARQVVIPPTSSSFHSCHTKDARSFLLSSLHNQIPVFLQNFRHPTMHALNLNKHHTGLCCPTRQIHEFILPLDFTHLRFCSRLANAALLTASMPVNTSLFCVSSCVEVEVEGVADVLLCANHSLADKLESNRSQKSSP